VLKSQLKRKVKKPKFTPEIDETKNFKDAAKSDRTMKNKSQAVLRKLKVKQDLNFRDKEDDSGVSDIDEAEYYDSLFERDQKSSSKEVTFPKINKRSKNKVYQSLGHFEDLNDDLNKPTDFEVSMNSQSIQNF
jgi:hypothetical protein